MKNIFTIVIFLLSLDSRGNVCMDAQSIDEMKSDYPMIVVGEVIEKIPKKNSLDGYNFRIKVKKVIHGEIKEKIFSGFSFERFGNERPSYVLNKEYYFPIIKTKNGKLEIEIPSQGCKIFPAK